MEMKLKNNIGCHNYQENILLIYPFVPSIWEEYAGEYFETEYENPFMQIVLKSGRRK